MPPLCRLLDPPFHGTLLKSLEMLGLRHTRNGDMESDHASSMMQDSLFLCRKITEEHKGQVILLFYFFV